jgi:site-specific DNA-adenine methylase
MNSNHFPISYAGNKRKEYIHFKENIDLVGKKHIIEPFCGTSAISFNIWREHGNAFTYHLNDNNENMINIYKALKTETIDTIEKEVNKVKDSVKSKEDYNNLVKKKDQSIYEYIYWNRYYTIRAGLYSERSQTIKPYTFNKTQIEFAQFVKQDNVLITNDKWEVIFDKYKNQSDVLFMIDPPYILSCNVFYQDKSLNIYEYFFENNITTFKSKLIIILEKNWIIELLFGKYFIHEYGKRYEASNKNTSHVIISN